VIIVDTSVWIDHFRSGDAALAELLEKGEVLMHPWVTGELALGNFRQRTSTLELLSSLPQARVAHLDQVLAMIEHEKLHGLGIGLVDAQILASTTSQPGTRLWTRDRRLAEIVRRLGVRFEVTA
jgi:predicted nucleic acid-binding protein